MREIKNMRQIYVPSEGETHTADVVVIGGGIVGTATAFFLSRAGLKVILVEMREGLSTLTSAASAECFRAEFTEQAMTALATQAIEVWDNFGEVIGIPDYDISIHRQGYLFVTDKPDQVGDLKGAVEQYHKLGVTDVEFLEPGEVLSRFPFVAPSVVAATFRQKDGWFSVHEATQGFVKGCDARFFVQTKVTDVLLDGKGVYGVATTKGTIETRTVVNAAGPFAGVIGRMVGIELPVEPVRRQKAFIAATSKIPQNAPFTVDVFTNSYWRPETGGGLVGWVNPDEPVSKPTEQCHGDEDFAAITLDKVSRLSPFWGEVAPGLKRKDVMVSAGQYVYTPDSQPLIGPVEGVDGFYLNCGYWTGVMFAPVVGQRVTDLIQGDMDPKDNPLRLSRFEEGEVSTGGTLLSR